MKRISLFVIWLVCIFGALITLVRMLWCVAFNCDKALVLAVAIDRASNAALNGEYTETISSRANRARWQGRTWGCVLCKWLDWLHPDHCRNSAGR